MTGDGGHERALRDLGLGDDDLAAWCASGLADDRFEEWLVDRVARRPSGARARRVYGAEDVHDFARRAILETLALGPEDHLLEIGCGGGLLLREALAAGARVTGIDHSQEMVELAHERAPDADIILGDAAQLPFGDHVFTALAMSAVFFFLSDPIATLAECRRVLTPGAGIAIFTTAPELRGTRAAPAPIADHGHFYTEAELARLARSAGLSDVAVDNDDGGQLLTATA